MKTPVVKEKNIKKNWYLIDAENMVLGRLASRIAVLLTGKHKPEYVDYMDIGDFVVVTNVEKVKMTGRKVSDKMYYRHTGYPGGLKQCNAETMLAKFPERVLLEAVKGMLPNNRLRPQRLKKLKLVVGSEHGYNAQKPEKIEL